MVNRTGTSRRRLRWYILVITGSVALALALRAFWLEPASLRVVEQRLDIPWPAQRPLRIAVLTDLHVGSPFNGLGKLRAVVARTNAARPDLVCILGDLVIQGVVGGRFVPPEAIAVELASLRAPAGVLAVLGNHDAWFVATGIGTSIFPVRFRVPPAVTLLTVGSPPASVR